MRRAIETRRVSLVASWVAIGLLLPATVTLAGGARKINASGNPIVW